MLTRLLVFTFAVIPLSSAQAQSKEQRIADAVIPLPEALRDGATVVSVDNSGRRNALREGTNHMICREDVPGDVGYVIRCYPKSLDAYFQRNDQLAAEGKNPEQRRAVIAEEIKSGKLKWPDTATVYLLAGLTVETAMPLTVVYIPNANGESTGLSEQRDNHRPWLMRANTVFAHIMIPGK